MRLGATRRAEKIASGGSRQEENRVAAVATLDCRKPSKEPAITSRAGDGIRTHDNNVGNVVLCQLSYTRMVLASPMLLGKRHRATGDEREIIRLKTFDSRANQGSIRVRPYPCRLALELVAQTLGKTRNLRSREMAPWLFGIATVSKL